MQVLKQEMRKRMLKAAAKEFGRNGYQAASMRTIAKGAGCTVGNLYRYYPDKEALFEAVVEVADHHVAMTLLAAKALEKPGRLTGYLSALPTDQLSDIAGGAA